MGRRHGYAPKRIRIDAVMATRSAEGHCSHGEKGAAGRQVTPTHSQARPRYDTSRNVLDSAIRHCVGSVKSLKVSGWYQWSKLGIWVHGDGVR